MEYRLRIADQIFPLTVSHVGEEPHTRFLINGKTYEVFHQTVSPGELHMVVNGKAVRAFVSKGNQGKHIFIDGHSFFVEDADNLLPPVIRRTRSSDSPGEVTPPMPSVVVRILVEEGEQVKQGQALVVVSAMKMETPLKAPSDGRVIKINTSLDAKVAPGDILVEIEKEEQAQ